MTTAITPNAGNHENLSGLQSRFVGVDDLPWEPTDVEGVETKNAIVRKIIGAVNSNHANGPRCRPSRSLPHENRTNVCS